MYSSRVFDGTDRHTDKNCGKVHLIVNDKPMHNYIMSVALFVNYFRAHKYNEQLKIGHIDGNFSSA